MALSCFLLDLFKLDSSMKTKSTSSCCLLLQPGISPEVRRKLGEAAVRAAKAVNYVGAGEAY